MGSKGCQGRCSSPLQTAWRWPNGLLQKLKVCRIGFLFHGGLTSALSPRFAHLPPRFLSPCLFPSWPSANHGYEGVAVVDLKGAVASVAFGLSVAGCWLAAHSGAWQPWPRKSIDLTGFSHLRGNLNVRHLITPLGIVSFPDVAGEDE